MAKVRVSSLAKEFGMSSKELLDHLAEMKIPAKSASSTLEDAYVSMVKKKLAPVLEARAAEIEAAKQAEKEAAEREEAEQERIAAERRREEERRLSQAALAAEEAARAAAEEAARIERERAAEAARQAELEAKRRAVPASDSGSRFRSLLDQIAAQEVVLKEKKEAETKQKADADDHRGARRSGRGDRHAAAEAPSRSRRGASAPVVPVKHAVSPASTAPLPLVSAYMVNSAPANGLPVSASVLMRDSSFLMLGMFSVTEKTRPMPS